MNGVGGGAKNWISDKTDLTAASSGLRRLVINGRLLTYNTRGGSLKIEGGVLKAIDGTGTTEPNIPKGYCAQGPTIRECIAPKNWQDAAAQDLERFRIEPMGNS